ncbi:MAG: 3D domain-containing protein [Defluviitaleaceae bacterium]|nr:3D domain-containing protein [Defluviitaleaceae bacterium]
MIRLSRVMFFLVVMLGVFTTTVFARELTLKTLELVVDGEMTRIQTTSETLGEVLEIHGIELGEKDVLSWPLDRRLQANRQNRVTLKTGFYVTVILDYDEEIEVLVAQTERIGHLIREVSEMFERTFHYPYGFMNDSLSPGERIYLSSSSTTERETIEKLSYEVKVIFNDELYEYEENVIEYGQVGEVLITTRFTYLGDERVAEEVISEEILKEPTAKVIEVGTKKEYTVETTVGLLRFSQRLVMEATAYSAAQPNLSNYTFTGIRAVRGVVAVDPRVIPLGTELYIVGYGRAIAADTGGAIRGNRIDLCFDTVREAILFGRQDVIVYILR